MHGTCHSVVVFLDGWECDFILSAGQKLFVQGIRSNARRKSPSQHDGRSSGFVGLTFEDDAQHVH